MQEVQFAQIRSAKIIYFVLVFCIAGSVAASAQTLTTVVNFPSALIGYVPTSLIQGTDGNFYGTTYYGGNPTSCGYTAGTGCGTVFKMTPAGQLSTLHSFCSRPHCSDGSDPVRLIQGTNGNFYGVTTYGGHTSNLNIYGYGTIFQITPDGVLTTIYSFCAQAGCPDGSEPAGLVQATNGHLYGVAGLGGAYKLGTVFEITSAGKLTTLYNFCPTTNCPDGAAPTSLMQASNLNFYGTTSSGGGPYNGGTVFEITPTGKLTTLDSFHRANPLIQAGDANFYGTTQGGGSGGKGTIFRMTPGGKLTLLHAFCPLSCATGDVPIAALAEGNDGNFYGSTNTGGNTYYAGSVYQISPNGTFTTLYLFCSETNCTDGWGGRTLIQATTGEFYGTTDGGGTDDSGTVFSLSMGLGPFVAARPNFGSANQTITILGNNLTGTTGVTFNGTAATFTLVSDTYIKAQVPGGATTGTIAVTTPSGTLSSNVAFQVIP